MKRIVIVAVVAVLATLPALASDRLINFGYNIQTDGETDFSRRSIGLVFTSLGGDQAGFYGQLAPYFALSSKSGGFVYKYSENDTWGGGLTFVLGYGRDINFGQLGLLVGGGFFGNLYLQYDTYYDSLYYNPAAGLGGGAHLYFQPGRGSLSLNVGVDLGWRFMEVYGYSDTGFGEFLFEPGDFNFNINAGIAFRR